MFSPAEGFCNVYQAIGILVDGESDRTVVSDTSINCTGVLFKSINTCVNTYILLVFYIVIVCPYFISTVIFNKNVSDHYLFWCPTPIFCPIQCPWVYMFKTAVEPHLSGPL